MGVVLAFAPPAKKQRTSVPYDQQIARANQYALGIADIALNGHDRAIQEDTSPCDMAPESV